MQFAIDREDWARRLATTSGAAHSNEAELRHAAFAVLSPYCIDVVGLAPSQLRHEGVSTSGRFDMLLGSTLIEFKSPGELDTKSKRRHHASQALRYLRDESFGASIVLITDGYQWGFLRDPSDPDQPTLSLIVESDVTDDELFQWRSNSEATALRVLDLLDTVRFEPVSPRSLMTRLGPTTTHGRAVLAALVEVLNDRSSDGRTDILFRQWLALAGVSYGIGDDATAWPKGRASMLGDLSAAIPTAGYAATIFVLHTYVALCSKLVATEALALTRGPADLRPSQWPSSSEASFKSSFVGLESGLLAAQLRAPRMMGGDLFGWYADELGSHAELLRALRQLVGSFAELAWARLTHSTRVSTDLLREFYTGVVPRQLRKGLGEFFTPEWIAERVVARAMEVAGRTDASTTRFLDPACGSGTFLAAAMRRSISSGLERGLEGPDLALAAVASVTGFDVNPVSPLMARVNLLLTLGDLADALPELELNVFQADSILIPEPPSGQVRLDQAHAELTLALVIGDVSLPRSLATLRAISGLARITDQSIQRDRDDEIFLARLRAEFPVMGVDDADADHAAAAALELYTKLRTLHAEGRDGVWAHVIEQSFAPRVLEPVDIVIGNPPWISWKNLPAEWRSRSQSTWLRWGLWQARTRGGGTPMGDISTLLLARSISTYAPNGVVALLLPEGMLINEPGGRAIRGCVLGKGTSAEQTFAPVAVDDFSELNPFPDAATRPIALYVKAGAEPDFPIGVTKWTRSIARVALPAHMPFVSARSRLHAEDGTLAPLDSNDIASPWRPPASAGVVDAMGAVVGPRYTWGQGFHTRGADGIYFCEVISGRPYAGGLVKIRTRPDLGRNTRDVESVETLIEASYLWPLVRGANVQPFRVESSNLYCIVPHDPGSLTTVLKTGDAVAIAPRMFDYFEPHLERLESRSAYDMVINSDYPWGIQGIAWRHMSRSRILVVSRYIEAGKRPPAAVYAPSDDDKLGFSTTGYPNNKVNFLACDSLAEADYVAAFMNSEPALQAIARRASSTTIAPNTLNALALPKFNESKPKHVALRDLGIECRVDTRAWPAIRAALDRAVENLLAN